MAKSAPFQSIAPFRSRLRPASSKYRVFPVDYINPAEASMYGNLALSPPFTDLVATSPYGGTPTPETVIYVLTNNGGATLEWSSAITGASGWLSLAPSSGTLLPGESVEVTITLNSSGLAMDTYNDTIEFTNITSGSGDTNINVQLTVTGEIVLAMEGRTKGGTATLIGFSEFTGYASTPPKKYRRLDATGQRYLCYHSGISNCSDPTIVGISAFQYNGSTPTTYDALTGAITYGQYWSMISLAFSELTCGMIAYGDGNYQNNINNLEQPTNLASTGGDTVTVSATQFSRVGNETCYIPSGSPNDAKWYGSTTWTLSVEDTEADAIVRLGAAYGAWGAITVKGDKKSVREQRTAFTFAVTEAQWRATAVGLYPNTVYSGQAGIYRRAYGSSDPWVLVSTASFSETTDGSGNFSHSDTLPNAAGYEYCAFGATLN